MILGEGVPFINGPRRNLLGLPSFTELSPDFTRFPCRMNQLLYSFLFVTEFYLLTAGPTPNNGEVGQAASDKKSEIKKKEKRKKISHKKVTQKRNGRHNSPEHLDRQVGRNLAVPIFFFPRHIEMAR